MWHERFGGRADVLGKELRLNSRVYTVVGVLPKAAEFPGGVRLWVPMQGNPTTGTATAIDGLGRLKPGITVEQAAADLLRVQQQIFDKHDKERVVSPFARDLRAQFTREFGTVASTLGAAVSLLLIVACANVAALMLARALARRREMGIRLAVGASRARVLRQLLVENILLSIAGGALGLVDRSLGDPDAASRPARSGARMDDVHARHADGDLHARHLHADRGPFRVGAGAACDELRRPRRDVGCHGRIDSAVRGRRTLWALVLARVRAGVADVRLRRAAGPRLRSGPQHRPGLRRIARADLRR